MSETTPRDNAPAPAFDAQDILDNAPIGIFTSTPEGRYTFANPAMARMYGYDSPEDLLTSVTDISRQIYVDPADRFRFYQMLENAESARNYESLHKRKDGSTFWALEFVLLVRNTDSSLPLVHGFVADISQQKLVQEKQCRQLLQTSKSLPADGAVEHGQEIVLKNIIDPSVIQQLMNDIEGLTGIGGALLDLHGNVLASTGWQDICFKFHRTHQETSRNCMESDSMLSQGVEPGQYKVYRCKNNMLDIVMPIMVEGRHLGNLFTGQFFFTDEPPDHEVFRAQARKYDFDEDEYLAALRRVPLLDKDVVTKVLQFYVKLAEIISTAGFNNLLLERHLVERESLIRALRESEEKHRRLFETMAQGVIYQAADGAIISANSSAERILGLTFDQMWGKTSMDPRWKMTMEDGSGAAGTDHPAMVALRTGETVGPVIRGVFHPDKNAHVWLSITAIPLFHPGETQPYQAYATFEDITESKQAEKALRRSENLFRNVFETLPIGLWIADKNGKLIQGNPAGVAIWGAEPNVGQQGYGAFRARRLPSGEEIASDDWALAYTVNKGATVVDELLEIDAFDGTKKIILNYTTPVLDETGKVEAAIVVNQEITSRYRAEEALRASEEKHRRLFETMAQGVIYQAVDGAIISANPAAERILGLSFDQLRDETFMDSRWKMSYKDGTAVSVADYPAMIALRTEETVGPVIRGVYHPDKKTHIWLSITSTPLFQPGDPRPFQSYSMFEDITESKRLEDDLLVSEERFRLSMDATSDGVWDWDIQTGNVYYSPGYVRMLGYASTDIPEHVNSWLDLIHPDDKEQAFKKNKECIENRVESFAVEFRMQAKNGEWKWILGRGHAVSRDGSGRAMRMIGTHQDITERKQAEQERESLQSQLLQAQKMESVGILAGGLAHDFNNLLHTMRGNVELISKNESLDPQVRTRLQTVTKSMDRGGQLVQQLLLFSRKAESRKMHVDLNQEVEGLVRILERTIPKMIALELHLAAEAWPLLADPVQVEQVLLNLVNNAVDAMPEGGRLTIETDNMVLDEDFVRTLPGAVAGRYVRLTVSDTGCGMDEKTLKHVFDPFFTTKEVDKGTGLGLASAYGIVKAHGGFILCSSEVGSGTTFRVYLPATDTFKTVSDTPHQPEAKIKANMDGDNDVRTILVVDDEPTIRELTQEALEDFGYTVLNAASGEEALRAYRECGHIIDLVLLDLNMPGMGGHKCLHELQRFDPAVKVIIASGYAVNSSGKDSLLCGAKGFIGKPYQLKELAAMVREVLEG